MTKALLFRGFDVPDRAEFERVLERVLKPMPYIYRSTPRTEVGARVYTATEYPATREIPLHCENAYQDVWPTRLLFYCEQAPAEGGETPLADVAEVTQALPEPIKREFRRKKVRYVRNYRPGVDLDWSTVFQTTERTEVEAYCLAHGIVWTWLEDEGLRTEQVCAAMIDDPRTGASLWFNQAHLFHPSALDDATHAALLSLYAPEELPRNATFGDKTEIPAAMLREIRGAYQAAKVSFPWSKTDVLHVDNLAVAHGRTPYRGQRSILVGMGATPDSQPS